MTERIEGGRRLTVREQPRNILVSIITVVFRARSELLPLIESVIDQKNEEIEFIIIDGGSRDGTIELLQEYASCIDYWLSEPDLGIYDAMNKGVANARGKFLLHLNAGDALISIPYVQLTTLPHSFDVAAFRVSVDDKEFRPSFGLALRLCNTLHHQGTFFRRDKFPKYNIRYRVFADFDVNQRLVKGGAKIRMFDQLVATHAGGGASDTATRETVSEFFRIIRNNHGIAYLFPAWLMCKYHGFMRRMDSFLARFKSRGGLDQAT